MTRSLKALGLALLAVFALGAVAAQGASAEVTHTFKLTSGGKLLTGVNIDDPEIEGTEVNHILKMGSATIKCAEAHFVGNLKGGLEEEDEAVATPSYGNCKIGANTVTVKNGEEQTGSKHHCTYEFDSDTTTNPASTTTGESATVTLSCETGQKIVITGPSCTLSLGTQGPLHGIKYTNTETTEPTDVELTEHVFGISYEAVGSGCALLGISTGTHSDMTYLGDTTITGWKKFNAGTGLHEEQVGVHVLSP